MKTILVGVVGIVIAILAVFILMYAVRMFNSASIQTKVIQPNDYIECVVVSGNDSNSVDCWEIKQTKESK